MSERTKQLGRISGSTPHLPSNVEDLAIDLFLSIGREEGNWSQQTEEVQAGYINAAEWLLDNRTAWADEIAEELASKAGASPKVASVIKYVVAFLGGAAIALGSLLSSGCAGTSVKYDPDTGLIDVWFSQPAPTPKPGENPVVIPAVIDQKK